MNRRTFGKTVLVGALALPSHAVALGPSESGGGNGAPLSRLREQAKAQGGREARVPLLPEGAEALKGVESLEAEGSGRVPHYLRAFGAVPAAARPFAHLIKTVYTRGAVSPAVKLAMGLTLAQLDGSPYAAAHLERLLRACGEKGRSLLRALEAGSYSGLEAPERASLEYARALGRGPTALNEATFDGLRAHYHDAQIVELAVTVCFSSYFSRLCEGAGLPVEPWAADTLPAAIPPPDGSSAPRVALMTDAEYDAYRELAERAKSGQGAAKSLGLGIAHSQRAMVRAPEQMRAWFGYWATVREAQAVDTATKLQVSFAVSMQNGCRYCTVHQVVGLRRAGVDVARLIAMKKDDSALTPREKIAVVFARQLTRQSIVSSLADYKALEAEFGTQGAFELLLQTCAFNFMNRFTDGLRLPSEDEAIKIYQEVYGPGSYEGYRTRQ